MGGSNRVVALAMPTPSADLEETEDFNMDTYVD